MSIQQDNIKNLVERRAKAMMGGGQEKNRCAAPERKAHRA